MADERPPGRMSGVLRDQIFRVREDAGLSKRKLALLADADPSTITQIDQGRSDPSVYLLERIAEACGVRVVLLRDKTAEFQAVLGGMEPADLRLVLEFARAIQVIPVSALPQVRAFLDYLGLIADFDHLQEPSPPDSRGPQDLDGTGKHGGRGRV